jgi:anti-sigma regulatory factor (Ser/Thr protein kinase)
VDYVVRLPHDPDAIPRARRELERVRDLVDDLTMRNAKLLTSELVTNAVRHVPPGATDGVTLRVERRDGHLRVEVADHGPGFTFRPRAEGQDPGSGWGLHMLSTIASRWGVETDGGARVWFELDVEDARVAG